MRSSPRHRRTRARLAIALTAATALTGAASVDAPQPSAAQTSAAQTSAEQRAAEQSAFEQDAGYEERPGIPTIETIDGSTPTVDDTALFEALRVVAAEQAEQRARLQDENPNPPGAQAEVGGLSVTYLTEPPANVRAVVDAAAARWDEVLATNPAGPVEIEFDWRPLPPNVLGLAAPTTFHRGRGLPGSAFFPVGLANTLLGTDLTPGQSEITVTLAANLADSPTGWYINALPTDTVPPSQVDLFTVVVHEIGHGLGFAGSGRNAQLDRNPVVYDLLARYEGLPVIGSGRVSEALTSNDLFIDIGGGRTAQLFAPSNFVNGVSFAHFDESPDPTTPGGLMTPAFGDGELNRTIDAATLGVMASIGWPVSAPVLQPRVTQITGRDGSITVNFRNELGRVGLPPSSHTVVVRSLEGAPIVITETVPWTDDAVTIADVPNDVPIEVTVTATAPTGQSATTTTVVTDRPTTVAVTGVGTTRTVRWQAPGQAQTQAPTYLVERRLSGIGSVSNAWTEVGRTSGLLITDADLEPGVYQYRVRAEFADRTSEAATSTIVGVADSAIRPMELDGQIGRLYLAFFARLPDQAGMSFWLGRRANGSSIVEIADQFATSPEFQTLLGEADDGRFVDAVYASVLGRPADPAGRAFWVQRLAADMTRGELMIQFSDTPEFVRKTDTVAVSGTSGAVARLYFAFLQRSPEPNGVAFWSDQLAQGVPLASIADGFATSVEFTSTYGALSDDDFLAVVYDNVLGRAGDDAGFWFWRDQLTAGASRGSVMLAFSNSPEFILTTGTQP